MHIYLFYFIQFAAGSGFNTKKGVKNKKEMNAYISLEGDEEAR